MNRKGFLHHILFLDIETVPLVSHFEKLNKAEQVRFETKTRYKRKELISAAEFYPNAGIWAEFGKVICISVAYLKGNEKEQQMVLESFYDKDERKVLGDFIQLLDARFNKRTDLLCAHNGKEFDFPFLARRMIINSIPVPEILNLFGKKPWEVRHLDTMELWKFGDYKHYTSLDLLASVLGISSPKDDLKGNDIAFVYYEENDLERIVRYCEKDTIAVAKVYLCLMGKSANELNISSKQAFKNGD